MKSKNKIIVCQDKEVFLYNTKLLRKEWSVEIKHKIAGISRFDNLVLISSYNWWGKVFSKFINFSSGEVVSAVTLAAVTRSIMIGIISIFIFYFLVDLEIKNLYVIIFYTFISFTFFIWIYFNYQRQQANRLSWKRNCRIS